MTNAVVQVPVPVNEPVRDYAPGSAERAALKTRLNAMLGHVEEIPVVVGGQRIFTGDVFETTCPHDHQHVLARVHCAGAAEVEKAIEAARDAWATWSEMRWEDRVSVFLKAAELLAGPWRDTVNAATMLDQSKTAHQAEIDSACELIDFWRFNPAYLRELYTQQARSLTDEWNSTEFRPLEGFVFAVTPFNFTSIQANLPTAPAMCGNVVLWKPAEQSTLATWYLFQLLEEAGLPPGVINFLPGDGPTIGEVALAHRDLAGVHFTGSTGTFQHIWRTVGENIGRYRTYPRLVGETGGKDFVFLHPSADVDAACVALVRGAFEYQGQKCSAASRAYVPRSLWPELSDKLVERIGTLQQGSPLDFRNFLCAVIDGDSFARITGAIERARNDAAVEIVCGGGSDDSKGWFIEPTVLLTTDPKSETMATELFGPVLTVYVYDDEQLDATLELCDTTSPYALTGAVFARDRAAIAHMGAALRHAAGNFYVNDKPTGAVVSQQPFGGARGSGTNDKAGSIFNLVRWVSQRSIKEAFVPPKDHRYPFMDAE